MAVLKIIIIIIFKRKKCLKNNSPSFYTALLHLILNYASPNHHYNRERFQLCLSQKYEIEMEPIMHMKKEG